MGSAVKLLMELTKLRIAVLSTVSTAAGYILFAERLDSRLLIVSGATLLLAMGSLALNQAQEHRTDALMERTKDRPIPSGRMSLAEAVMVSLGLLFMGLVSLWGFAGLTPMWLGVICVGWYNGVYTYLKRRTAFAAVPGSLIGAIPPMIGWTAAGGAVYDPAILSVAMLFFVWQVPHFWLLLHRYGRQYEQAGLSSLTSSLSPQQLTRVTFVWIVATAVTSLSLPVFGAVRTNVAAAALLACASLLVWKASSMLRPGAEERTSYVTFRAINIFVMVVIVILSVDSLV